MYTNIAGLHHTLWRPKERWHGIHVSGLIPLNATHKAYRAYRRAIVSDRSEIMSNPADLTFSNLDDSRATWI